MGIFASIRERIGNVIAAVIGSLVLLGCGLLFLLFLAPQEKLEANRIEKLPLMDAASVINSTPGDDILLTGVLHGQPLPNVGSFIAYDLDEWDVDPADPENPDDKPSGSWTNVERIVPSLELDVGGQMVFVHSNHEAYMNGQLHEEIAGSGAYLSADDGSTSVSDGSLRYRGFYDGDLATVWGKKASTEGVIPEELYAGDRVMFITHKHNTAKGLMIAGISMLVCSPIVLVGGILSAIFGRRRGRII